MNESQLTPLVLIALMAALSTACSPQAAPKAEPIALSDENCRPESIAKIMDKDAREAFGSMCFSRGKFKPSPKKEW